MNNHSTDIMNKIKPVKNELFCFNKSKVELVKKKIPKSETVNKITKLFSVLSDKTRLKILYSISEEELCVCDIANVLGVSLSAVSHQLRILRNLDLVKFKNEGKMSLYSLCDKDINRLLQEYK